MSEQVTDPTPPAASDLERARNILRGWWECDDPRALSEIVGLALAAARAEGRDEGDAEIKRLNEWADGFSDAQLKERRLCEERIREITAERDAARAEGESAVGPTWDAAAKALRDAAKSGEGIYWANWLAANKPGKGEP